MTAGGKPLPCSLCKKELEPVFTVGSNKANSFVTYGTYGSEYFDPIDESYIYLNICDVCLKGLVDNGLALIEKD